MKYFLNAVSLIASGLILSTPLALADETKINLEPSRPQANLAHGRLWNLQDADILSVINEVSLETGKNFVVDPRVTGKISLISSKPIEADQVYNLFLSVLELLGFSAIETENVVKIVPNIESTEMSTKLATSQKPGHGGEVVVRIIALDNVSAVQILPVIRPMLPQWSNVSTYGPGNALILVGHAANLQRIAKVIKSLDSATQNGIQIVPLHQASAAQVVAVLNNLQNAGRANGDNASVSIVADERSNSILLSGNRSARLHMQTLIAQLDAPVIGTQGNTDVVYLRYLQAKNVAPILGKIAQNITHAGDITQPGAAPLHGGTNNAAKDPDNQTMIQAEKDTNAIIITAPPSLMRSLKTIVSKLDVRPAQVLVEAIIVEISQDDLNNLGIQWGSRLRPTATPDAGGSGAIPSVSFPPLGEGTLGIIPGTQIRAILSALQNKTGVNILSTPSVVVLDNQKAMLKVGQDVPFQNGSYATTGNTGTVTPYNTITSKPVVLQLNVTPQINLGNAVRLQINLKNDTLQNPENPTLNPIIKTSQIANSVIINSEDILVIGGLTSSNMTESMDKIPFLGDIPVAGILFRHKIRKLEKKNLVAFIKPVILHNAADSNSITNDKYDAIRQHQIDWPVNLNDEGQQKLQNILPLLHNSVLIPQPFEEVHS